MLPPDLKILKDYFEEALFRNLENYKSAPFSSKHLIECMRYALNGKGKRLRPLMVLASAFGVSKNNASLTLKHALPSALAIEYVHTYSLIHDDLPAMDNDDYRRGRLSAHRQFNEGLAILAGDALLADAFSLAMSSTNNPCPIGVEISNACGSSALVAGQALDLLHDDQKNAAAWMAINQAKTARLFEAAAVIGGLSQDASSEEITRLRTIGSSFGMAFQIEDDLNDEQGLYAHLSTDELLKLKMNFLEIAHDKSAQLPSFALFGELFKSINGA
jgi:geranylgeranyl diphosphate synthase type II